MTTKDAEARRTIGPMALRGFFLLVDRWQLSRQEAMTLLGITATSTYANWKKGHTSTLPRDTLERLSYIIGLDSTLQHIYPNNHEAQLTWLHSPLFYYPLQQMLQGNVSDLKECLESLEQIFTPHIQVQTTPLSPQIEQGRR